MSKLNEGAVIAQKQEELYNKLDGRLTNIEEELVSILDVIDEEEGWHGLTPELSYLRKTVRNMLGAE